MSFALSHCLGASPWCACTCPKEVGKVVCDHCWHSLEEGQQCEFQDALTLVLNLDEDDEDYEEALLDYLSCRDAILYEAGAAAGPSGEYLHAITPSLN